MPHKHSVTNEDLARMIGEIRSGINDLKSGQESIAQTLADIANGLDDLTQICKDGFDDTPSRREFDTFRTLVLTRHKLFAKLLKVRLLKGV